MCVHVLSFLNVFLSWFLLLSKWVLYSEDEEWEDPTLVWLTVHLLGRLQVVRVIGEQLQSQIGLLQ